MSNLTRSGDVQPSRLLVELDPAEGTLRNLALNGDGTRGASGWSTPTPGGAIVPFTGAILDNTISYYSGTPAVGAGNVFYSEEFPLTAGQWAGAAWEVRQHAWGYRSRMHFLSPSGGSTGATSWVTHTGSGYRSIPASAIPSGTFRGRVEFEMRDSLGAFPMTQAGVIFEMAKLVVSESPTAAEMGYNRRNLCPNPSFEVDSSWWVAGSGCTIGRTTAQAYVGAASLSIVPTGSSGSWTVTSPTGGVPIAGGRQIYVRLALRPG
ncbi:MAG: hypothetical protein ACRCY8_09825, partial [Dermatophilaceae bacterium]